MRLNLQSKLRAAPRGLTDEEITLIKEIEKKATQPFLNFVERQDFREVLALGPAGMGFNQTRSVRPAKRVQGGASAGESGSALPDWKESRAIGTVHSSTFAGINAHLMGLGEMFKGFSNEQRANLKRLYSESPIIKHFVDSIEFLMRQEDPEGFAAFAGAESQIVNDVKANHGLLQSALKEITGRDISVGGDPIATNIRKRVAELIKNHEGPINEGTAEAKLIRDALHALLQLRGSSG
jgi:hypothetical protein